MPKVGNGVAAVAKQKFDAIPQGVRSEVQRDEQEKEICGRPRHRLTTPLSRRAGLSDL